MRNSPRVIQLLKRRLSLSMRSMPRLESHRLRLNDRRRLMNLPERQPAPIQQPARASCVVILGNANEPWDRLRPMLETIVAHAHASAIVVARVPADDQAGWLNRLLRELNPAFVLMEYFGYLRRNPDDAPDNNFNGYDFWLNKLNSFADFRQAEMVEAFISSSEYRSRFGQQ